MSVEQLQTLRQQATAARIAVPPAFASQSEFVELFGASFFFLHVPKTGGTSLEDVLPAAAQLVTPFTRITRKHNRITHNSSSEFDVKRAANKKLWRNWTRSSPWHLPPDVYERRFGVSYSDGRPIFCVVRNPIERLLSRLAQRECVGNSSLPPDLEAEAAVLQRAQAQLNWLAGEPIDWMEHVEAPLRAIEATMHALPQTWFVFTQEEHAVQCHCVVAFEKLAHALNETRRNAAGAASRNETCTLNHAKFHHDAKSSEAFRELRLNISDPLQLARFDIWSFQLQYDAAASLS